MAISHETPQSDNHLKGERMDSDRFIKIMQEGDSDLSKYDDDNAMLGLLIIRKYLPKIGIEGADHDIIYSASVDKLVMAGITENDIIELRKLNWMVEKDEYLACYV
jgi:hypothetical protein